MRHANIPIFIADRGCPHRCAFCNQKKITGVGADITPSAVKAEIDAALHTLGMERKTEIAFFGGSFSGLEAKEQEAFLSVAHAYVKAGQVSGIRLSTRPDLIDEETLNRFCKYGVSAVELGAQSMDDGVLQANLRGHSADDTRRAAEKIQKRGISLGLQMMIGLKGDTKEKSICSAGEMIALKPETIRIYPAVVLRETLLSTWYEKGEYTPLTVEEAVDWCCAIKPLFLEAGVNVLRVGLMASDSLLGGEIVAGPFHSAFGELVDSERMLRRARAILGEMECKEKMVYIFVAERAVSRMIGNRRENVKKLCAELGLKELRVCAKQGLSEEEMEVVVHSI